MKTGFLRVTTALLAVGGCLIVVYLMASVTTGASGAALAAPLAVTVTDVEPSSAANDLDTLLVITGTGFSPTSSVYLGSTALPAVTWFSASRLEAVAPWGMDTGVYTLTVQNPDGESGSLAGAFNVTQGVGVWNAAALYGGDVSELVINPAAPGTLYAVSEKVGLFRSLDGADSWHFLAASDYARALRTVPADPDVLYLSMSSDWWGSGLHRSDDGGETWTQLDTRGDRAWPHPTLSDTVFASNYWEGDSGLWKSTDSGQTWVTMTNGLTDTRVSALAYHPTTPTTMIAGTEIGNLFISADGGESWTFLGRPTDLIQTLAFNPRGDHELWLSNGCFSSPAMTLKSTNAGYTAWAPVADPVGSGSMRTIVFPPPAWGGDAYSSTVFVAGCFGQPQRTDDSGDSWIPLDALSGGYGSALVLHPSDPNRLYYGTSSDGVLRTADGGATWEVANDGLAAVIPKQLVTFPGEPDTLLARTQREGGLYRGTRGGEVWQFLPVPDAGSGFALVDPTTPGRVYAGGTGDNRVPVAISEDGGESWPITAFIPLTEYLDCANWVSALVGHPTQPGTLVLGMEHFCFGVPGIHDGDLYYSLDAGLTWTRAVVSGMEAIGPVTDIAYDGLAPATIYAATGWEGEEGGGLLRSTDGGQTWARIGADVPGLDYVAHLAAEPRDPYRVFAWTDNVDGLYVSTDHGDTWAPAPEPLLHAHLEDMVWTDQDSPVLYAAVSLWPGPGAGLYRWAGGAEPWERAAGALGHVPVYSLATLTEDNRTLVYAGTTGGYVDAGQARAPGMPGQADTLIGAGVYRYTERTWTIYVPLVLKAHLP